MQQDAIHAFEGCVSRRDKNLGKVFAADKRSVAIKGCSIGKSVQGARKGYARKGGVSPESVALNDLDPESVNPLAATHKLYRNKDLHPDDPPCREFISGAYSTVRKLLHKGDGRFFRAFDRDYQGNPAVNVSVDPSVWRRWLADPAYRPQILVNAGRPPPP